MSKPPKPLVRFSGGQPNMPRGEPPFIPLNPWGRPMPKFPEPDKEPRCQVVVRDRKRGNAEVRIGPQMAHEFAEMLRLTIAEQIRLGREKQWSNPVVVTLTPALGRPVAGVF